MAAVVVIVVVFVALSSTAGTPRPPASSRAGAGPGGSATGATPVPAPVLRAVGAVGEAVLTRVGTPAGDTGPTRVSGNGPILLGPDGKPEVLYVGAEYCPFCAAQRWALVVALSRFGSFTGLAATHSSSTDVYPDTPTFSFYGSTFTSPSLDFVPVELETNQAVGSGYPALQHLDPAQQAVLDTYDRSPYSPAAGSIPFVDVGNRFVGVGAGYDPSVLSGLSMTRIADALADPASPVARAVDGTANLYVAAISRLTGVHPTP